MSLFRRFFDFRKGEFSVVLLLFFFFFLIIAVFQLLKPLKNGLFIENYGADIELYAKLANILVAALGVILFSALYNRLNRRHLIYSLCGFFIVIFVVLTYFLQEPGPATIWSFYLIGDLESTLMVAAFWAFATDAATTDQAKRLFGAVGAGGVIGGWVGISVATALLESMGMVFLLYLAAGMMLLVAVITGLAESQISKSGHFFSEQDRPRHMEITNSAGVALDGAKLVFRSKYLLAIVGILGFYEITSQVMDYQFKLLTEDLSGVTETQAFMASVYWYANVLSVAVQLFFVSFIMRKFGLIVTLLVMPVALLASSVAFLAVPTLFVASFLIISDNGLNYSIQQTGRESLYIVTSAEEKYKARAFTNMFVQRAAKGIGIFAVIGLGIIGVAARYLSIFTILVILLMIFVSVYAGRRFQQRSESGTSG